MEWKGFPNDDREESHEFAAAPRRESVLFALLHNCLGLWHSLLGMTVVLLPLLYVEEVRIDNGDGQLIMSALYSAGVEEVLEGPATPSDGKAAARSTFFAALIYVFLFGFCFFQVRRVLSLLPSSLIHLKQTHLNNLKSRAEEGLDYINIEERERLNG